MTATALKMPERTHCLTLWIILGYTGTNSLGDIFLGTLLRSCQLVMELSKKIKVETHSSKNWVIMKWLGHIHPNRS